MAIKRNALTLTITVTVILNYGKLGFFDSSFYVTLDLDLDIYDLRTCGEIKWQRNIIKNVFLCT